MRHASLRTVTVRARPSARLLRVCASFGVMLRRSAEPSDVARRAATSSALAARLAAPGRLTLISGPSGSGKSAILRAMLRRVPRAAMAPHPSALDPARPLFELLPGSTRSRLALLASCGLAEVMLLPRRVRELPEGQRARAAVALALARAARRRGATLLIDELGSGLDDQTARSLIDSLARHARHLPALRVVGATCRDDLPRTVLVLRTTLTLPGSLARPVEPSP